MREPAMNPCRPDHLLQESWLLLKSRLFPLPTHALLACVVVPQEVLVACAVVDAAMQTA